MVNVNEGYEKQRTFGRAVAGLTFVVDDISYNDSDDTLLEYTSTTIVAAIITALIIDFKIQLWDSLVMDLPASNLLHR
jgi:hypothetical protein